MTHDPHLEEVLRALPTAADPQDPVWHRLAAYLVQRLSEFVGRNLTLADFSVVDGEVLSSRFSGSPDPRDPLELGVEGLLGTERSGEVLEVSATLFVYASGRRLSLTDPRRNHIDLHYKRDQNGSHGSWMSLGWQQDDFGEYDAYAIASWHDP